MLALLSSVMYILSGENIAPVYPICHDLLKHQNSWQVDNQATQGRDIVRPIAPSSSMGAPQSSCRNIHTGAEDLVGRRVPRCALDNLGVQKVLAPSKYPSKWPISFARKQKIIFRIFKISGTL
jgi:hypothetical protein